ncbi:MAG: ribbon-helix-helix domain-containing protein [Planctomycetes bacterium]|nr:ribbon-helix-helix domain-containing protein [Planctomycetota bacterium]
MRTAITVPDDVLRRTDLLSRRTEKSRSQIFTEALREYLTRHVPCEVTETMDRVCAVVGEKSDRFVASTAHRTIAGCDW